VGSCHPGRPRLIVGRSLILSSPAPDITIVGAGAAGLATAIFVRRLNPSRSVLLLDSAARPGAKILVSGGSRCNVTNAIVSERDFWGGRRTIIRRILRTFSVTDTVAFFSALGVPLHEEAHGKLFPDSNRSRDVLDALLREAAAAGVVLRPSTRVTGVGALDGGWRIETPDGEIGARTVVLATGGQSLPKSGSDGAGLEIARRLGHSVVPPTPALVPLVLAARPDALHLELQGVAHPAELSVWIDGALAIRLGGDLLWTHFGISGPAALDASRHCLRAQLEARTVRMTMSFCPGESFESFVVRWTSLAAARPRASIHSTLASTVPASVASALLRRLTIDGSRALAHFSRGERTRLAHALLEWPLDIAGSRGYTYAEATAGGVALEEIDPPTMASKRCNGLYFVGEILDVDGRLGGFNFQWAWSSARTAALALA
jgi:predicted Rossmann fold flavoprotein